MPNPANGLMSEDQFDYDDHDDEDEDGDMAEAACSRLAGGGCADVGTEFCEWSCPFHAEAFKR